MDNIPNHFKYFGRNKQNIQRKTDAHSLTKEELLESMLMSEDEGIIDEKESDVIENILNLDNIKVSEVLTPRSVVFCFE